MSDRTLELMADMLDLDLDESLERLTSVSNGEIEEKMEKHFEDMLTYPRREYKNRYERGAASDINANTYKQREIAVEQFVDWYQQNWRSNLEEKTFHVFLRDMLQDGYGAETMVSRYWQLVKFVKTEFNGTIESEIRAVDHTKLINKYRDSESGEGKGARPITREEYELMIEAAQGNRRLELILECLWQMGLRSKECAELRVSDFDWKNRRVNVRTAKQTDDDTRPLKIDIRLKNELRKWEKAERHEYAHGGQDYMFPTRKNEHILPRNLTHAVRELADKVGIQEYNEFYQNGARRAEITPHSFRKSFGLRRLREPDGNLRKVQLLLGHSDVRTTQIYLDLDEDDLDYNPK